VLRHIRAVAAEAKQELMNAFRREMSLQLVAISRDKSSTDSHFRSLQRLKKKKSEKPTQPRQTSRYDIGDVEY